MVEEREDGVERLRHEGRVHRWSRQSPAWPGHTTFVALRGGEAVLGDRYATEGVERTYACDLRSLLDGCFHGMVAEQLGARVLEELLVEARRELGEGASTLAGRGAGGPLAAAPVTAATIAAEPTAAASRGSASPAPAKVVSAPAEAARSAKASERRSVAAAGPNSAGAEPGASTVDVTVVGCRGVGLPLAVALRGITRASVQDVLERLRTLPCRVAAGVPREQAEGLAARLAALGAEVRLLPAGAS